MALGKNLDINNILARVEANGGNWTHEDSRDYFALARLEEKSRKDRDSYLNSQGQEEVRNPAKDFFDSETMLISQENGMVIPKDFEGYVARLNDLIDYVDEVIRSPDKRQPVRGLCEIGDLKYEMLCNLGDIERYLEAGGSICQGELKDIQTRLEGRLVAFELPVSKLKSIIGNRRFCIPKRYGRIRR